MVFDNDFPAKDFLTHCPVIAARIGVASLACYSPFFAGVAPLYDRVWSAAVDFLVHLIHTHQCGIPECPQRILLKGAWVPGQTAPRRMRRAWSEISITKSEIQFQTAAQKLASGA